MTSEQQARPSWAVRIQAEREARRWGKHEMARRLMQAAGLRRGSVANLARQILDHEKGKHFPREWAHAYAAAFGMEPDDLFPAPARDTDGHDAVTAAVGTFKMPALDLWDDDVKRRAALQLIAAIGAGSVVPPGVMEELLSGIDHVLGRADDLGEWERVVHEYGHQIYRRPFESFVPAVTADIVAVGELLRKGRPPREQAGLLRVSAGLSGILAEALGNLGEDRAARRTWHTARRAADASGDRTLRVWVRGRAAQWAGWASGSHHSVMAMVRDAEQIADGTPSSGLARAYAASAYMAASHGDIATARHSLGMLKRTFEHLPHGSGEQSILEFQESQLHWNEAYVHTIIGDGRAGAMVDHTETFYPPTAAAPIVNLRLMRSVDLVRRGEVREGTGSAVASLQGRPRPVMATRHLAEQVLAALPDGARDLSEARELRGLISAA
ncbi:helix-turn-helix transcriptional regulator [Actinomadura sp. NPDC048394]|uniref:helix-turn-helix transcriptional regulator n=1 Tax=Actinomadura sp. NPDC048394 TaxID=3158223 RepID=UPI0033E9F4CE